MKKIWQWLIVGGLVGLVMILLALEVVDNDRLVTDTEESKSTPALDRELKYSGRNFPEEASPGAVNKEAHTDRANWVPGIFRGGPPAACARDFRSRECGRDIFTRCGLRMDPDTFDNLEEDTPEWNAGFACLITAMTKLAPTICAQEPNSAECLCADAKDPYSCVVEKQIGVAPKDIRKAIICPLKAVLSVGRSNNSAFADVDCSGFETQFKNKLPPEYSCDTPEKQRTEECQQYLQANCADSIYSYACKSYCEEQMNDGNLDQVCAQYYLAYCTTVDYSHPGCKILIQQEYPNAADFCSRFPQLQLCRELGF